MKNHIRALCCLVTVCLSLWQALADYNPLQRPRYSIRSQPEGELFETISEIVSPGDVVTSPSCSHTGTHFAYWLKDGAIQTDDFGRALDSVSVTMTEEAFELVAVCVTNQYERGQMYWYGTTNILLSSDTDSDGYTLQEEIDNGTNPLLKEYSAVGGINAVQSDLVDYNPVVRPNYVIRSEPEGELFETMSETVSPGGVVTSPTCSRTGSHFAYWLKDGVIQTDDFGRALDSVSVTMTEEAFELVAVCVSNQYERGQLYWYGTTNVLLSSDTDADGYTLQEEIDNGTNPLLKEYSAVGGVNTVQSDLVDYNPVVRPNYVIRSAPEGELFETISETVSPSNVVTSPSCSHTGTHFAYWLKDGVVQTDDFGRALDSVSVTMTEEAFELVAVCVSNQYERGQLYWYGTTNVLLSSDTDADGFTLQEEIDNGTNPLLKEYSAVGGINCSVMVEVTEAEPDPQKADGGPYTETVNGIAWTFTVTNGESCVTGVSKDVAGSVTIPETLGGRTVTEIATNALSGCAELTAVTIPAGVTKIGAEAFSDCPKLADVTFAGDTVSSIAGDAFARCNWDLVVHVPNGWTGRSTSLSGHTIVREDATASQSVYLTVTNVVVQYVLNSVQPEIAVPVSGDTGFVAVITEIKSSGAVSVPNEWKDNYPSFTATYGSDMGKALMMKTGKKDGAGNEMLVWQDFVAGTDPTDENDKFTASITMVDGVPVVSYTPELTPEQTALRTYKTFGKKQLQDTDWTDITDLNGDAKKPYNFFKVTVEMK